jgi:HlyD family secretion protein
MKPSEKNMKHKLIWIVPVAVVLALLIWALMPAPREVETALVTQGRFERAVQEDGKTRLRERYQISAALGGHLERMALKQGDDVAQDAPVARLWPSTSPMLDARSRAEQLAANAALQAALLRSQSMVERAGAALTQAQANLQRSQSLEKQGFVAPARLETDRLSVHMREQELASARQDVVAARFTLARSQATLEPISTNGHAGSPFVIRSPVAGKVLKVLQPSAGMVMAGTPLLEVGDPTRLEVVVDVLTEDAAQIRPGTPVQLANWGGPDTLQGTIRRVEPSAFTKVSALGVEEQRVNTLIDILSPAESWSALGDGFKLDVRILVQVVEDALLVPVSALFPLGTRSALLVMEGGRARLKEVDVEARNGVSAWIKSGLTVGAQVIVYPDSQLQDGDRIKAR